MVSHSDEKTWGKCSYAYFTRFWKSLTCWLSKEFLKRCFLKSGLTKSFTVCNFRNKVAMTIIFFFKMFKIWCRFQKWIKKIENFFGFKDHWIWVGDNKFSKSPQEYFSLQSICYETSPRFDISLREIFFKSDSIRAMEK